jgi:hypothetical protein
MFRKLIARATDLIAYPIGSILDRVALRQIMDLPLERRRRALAATVDFLEQNLTHLSPSWSKFELLSKSFQQADTSGNRLVCEFGVFKGSTINHIATLTSKTVFGFDSFEGLPEKWNQGLQKGHFAVKKLPRVRENVTLIKGWFDQTLPSFLEKNPGMIGFLHVDCDLYSSTKIVFDLLQSRLAAGAVIVFDEYFNHPEWEQGEHKAFHEFLKKADLSCEYIGYNCKGEQLAVKLKSNAA